MTLLWADSFDHYGENQHLLDSNYFNNASGALPLTPVSTSPIRTGSGCVRFDAQAWALKHVVTVDTDTLVIGAGFHNTGWFNSAQFWNVFAFLDVNLGIQCLLRTVPDQRLYFYRGDAATELGRSTRHLILNKWYFIEMKVNIHDTTGSFEVRVNGEVWIQGSGVDTKASAATGVQFLGFFRSDTGFGRMDDLYVCSTGAGQTNDFIGESAVQALFPNADDTPLDFTPTPASPATLFDKISEATPNDDTSYIESNNVNSKGTFGIGNLGATATEVWGVVVHGRQRKTDAGDLTMRHNLLEGANTLNGPTLYPTLDYTFLSSVFDAAPGGGGWTPAKVNNSKIQIERLT